VIQFDSDALFEELKAPDINDASGVVQCFKVFKPHPHLRALTWAVRHVVTDQGRPYDHRAYPHLGNPGGPLDALDDSSIRTIAMMFATRLGKSFVGQVMLLYYADMDPCPMLLASESERSLKRIMARQYKMVYQRKTLRDKLLFRSERDHKQDHMVFKDCEIRGAWSRSAGTLADMNIRVGVANELDKDGWDSQSTTKEGSPEKLYDDRFKDYQAVRKSIYESTPTVRGRSRIERRVLLGANCRFWVPCPHCDEYQTLRMGHRISWIEYDWGQNGRLQWDLDHAGKHNRELARNTARYICVRGCEISNEWRAWMMRRGVWAPEGCVVDTKRAEDAVLQWNENLEEPTPPVFTGWKDASWIIGDPVRDGPDASYQLSSLYALSLGWGDIAAEFVDSIPQPQVMRNYVNQWLGETWEHADRKMTWQQLGAKLIDNELPPMVCPSWSTVLTAGVDKQADKYVWVLSAWGPGRRHATVAYGEHESLESIIETLLRPQHVHADGGEGLIVKFGLIDSGFRATGVYELCSKAQSSGIPLFPCKGARSNLEADFRHSRLGQNTSWPGMNLFWVDGARTQCWLDNCLHTLEPNDPGGLTLHAGSLEEHQDYLEQLLNDAPIYKLDATNNERENWERIDQHLPNDYRDCERYSYVAMLLATRGAPIRPRGGPNVKRNALVGSVTSERPRGRRWS
jgi:phage terminase large subunit GpA-like protein